MECAKYIKNKCNNITVCTNGYLFCIDECDEVIHIADNISWSLHHWNFDVNEKIMGLNLKINHVILNNQKINISCNFIKGYVDSEEGVINVLEKADDLGIREVAFVGLMSVNDYCKENFIKPFEKYQSKRIFHYNSISYHVEGKCKCDNYIYFSKKGNIIKFYSRHNLCPSYDKGSTILYKNNLIHKWY